MLIRTFVAAALVGALLDATALAQPAGSSPFGTTGANPFGYDNNGGDWLRCANEERRYSLEVAVESCERILAERRGGYSIAGAVYWNIAMRYQDAEQFDRANEYLNFAVESFAEFIRREPREYVGYSNRASVLARLGRYDEALADYDRAAALESHAASPWLGRGNVLFRRGDYEGASAAYDRAARIGAYTGATNASYHAARCAVRAASHTGLERGRDFCNRGVRSTDTPSYPLTARGFYWFMQGDLAAAGADFARAVEEDPYNASAVYGRGVVAAREGRAAEGEADMTRGLTMDRYEVEYYANAGLRP